VRAEARLRQAGDGLPAARAAVQADLERALALAPASSDALALRAYARLEPHFGLWLEAPQEPERSRAEADARAAVETEPEHPLAHLVLAVLARGRALRTVEAHLDRAVADPAWRLHATLLLGVLRYGSDLLLARETFEEAATLAGDAPGLAWEQAFAHTHAGALALAYEDFPLADRHLLAALELDPEHPAAPYHLANLRMQQGLVDDALQAADQAVRSPPHLSDELALMVELRLSSSAPGAGLLGDLLKLLDEADRLQAASRGYQSAARLGLLRARCLVGLDRWAEALPHLERTRAEGTPKERREAETLLEEARARLGDR
jgi:hypothetical protein